LLKLQLQTLFKLVFKNLKLIKFNNNFLKDINILSLFIQKSRYKTKVKIN